LQFILYHLLHECVFEKKLLDCMLTTNDNLNKKLKSDLGYQKLSCVKTSNPNYLNWLQKDLFAMIR